VMILFPGSRDYQHTLTGCAGNGLVKQA